MTGERKTDDELVREVGDAAEERRDEDVEYVRHRQPPRDPSQVYTVRIPVTKLEELRRVAEDRGVEPSVLMRRWVLERLDQEAGRADQEPTMIPAAAVREAIERLFVEYRRAS